MQHRGTARRRVLIAGGDETLPEAGSEITAGGRAIGTLGSVSGEAGLAMVRIDRVKDALDGGQPILAGSVPLRLPFPAGHGSPSRKRPTPMPDRPGAPSRLAAHAVGAQAWTCWIRLRSRRGNLGYRPRTCAGVARERPDAGRPRVLRGAALAPGGGGLLPHRPDASPEWRMMALLHDAPE